MKNQILISAMTILTMTGSACRSSEQQKNVSSETAPAQSASPATPHAARPSKDAKPAPVAVPKPGSLKDAAPEGTLLVPGGTFTMGLDHPRAIPDEMTEHAVIVRSFYLDKTEVTNAAYNACVQAGVCASPKWIDTVKGGFAPLEVFRQDLRPVSGVSQHDAMTFCKWKGKRLPTEAEFERAARGDDGRLYAWGNETPSPKRAVYASKVTEPVGSRPDGAGPYGHLDLAGNVWEWTADLYDPFAYSRDTANKGVPADCPTIKQTQKTLRNEGRQGFTGTNPIPTDCDTVLRGGAFNYFSWGLRASNRVHHPADFKIIMAGFRCAKDAP